MKLALRIIASFITAAIALPVSAIELPANYQARGKLDGPYVCDKGKTTVKQYINKNEGWGVLEVYTESGDILIDSGIGENQTLAIKNASGTKDVSHSEWDAALFKAAPMVFHILHHETSQSDCAPAPAQTN